MIMETLKITRKENYALVQLRRGKANPINHQMVKDLTTTFTELQEEAEIKGVILTGTPNFFSAGLDVVELYDYDEDQMRNFMIDFGTMHVQLSRFPKPMICAIPGYCPAGGTVIAITADYRVMNEDSKFSLGLNEMKVNVQITTNLIEAYTYWLGTSLANRYILEGKLLTPPEALKVQLVDEICPADEVMVRAELKLQEFLQADSDIFGYTKSKLREKWHAGQELKGGLDLEQTLKIWWKPEIRAKIASLIASFKNKKNE